MAEAQGEYNYEAERHFKIIDDRLAKQQFMVGGVYTVIEKLKQVR